VEAAAGKAAGGDDAARGRGGGDDEDGGGDDVGMAAVVAVVRGDGDAGNGEADWADDPGRRKRWKGGWDSRAGVAKEVAVAVAEVALGLYWRGPTTTESVLRDLKKGSVAAAAGCSR
jgi:hypothetical protein